MTENRNTEEDEDFVGYLCYGDGAVFSLVDRLGEDIIMERRKRESVRENYEQVVRKWIAYFQGSEEDGNPEPEGASV